MRFFIFIFKIKSMSTGKMTFSWSIIFLVVCFVAHATSNLLAILPENGQLIGVDASQFYTANSFDGNYLPFYLPMYPPESRCNKLIDAQYTISTGSYQIIEWYYEKMGDTGISVKVSVTDLQRFVSYCHSQNILQSCTSIWDHLQQKIVKPMILRISEPIGSTLYNEENGVLVALYCGNYICDASTLMTILRAAPRSNNIHTNN